jgi:MoaA/NifB/PqqE/SkfB family radical SAM enzyme
MVEEIKKNITKNEVLFFPDRNPPLETGINKYIIGILIRLSIIYLALKNYYNPLRVIRVLKRLESLRKQYMGNYSPLKLLHIGKQYYWDMHSPGWPSKAFDNFNESEMNRIYPFRESGEYLNSVIFAITKKCSLSCKHCYEWDELNKEEKLSPEDLKKIVSYFQSKGKGVAQIQLSGGEPLSRFDDMIELLKSAKPETDFWIITSGYKLTLERAIELKNAGLKGMAISLDHYDPEKHNAFRGSDNSFAWVINAVENAHKAGLVVVLLLCPTREFTTYDNLITYAGLAKRLGAAFILLIEPRSVGRFAGKDVALTREQELVLEEFYLKMNSSPEYSDMPAVSYHGYHQRRTGCFGSGSRYLYVDTNGDIHICPFCRQNMGNVLGPDISNSLGKIKNAGCHKYKHAEL